MSEKQFVVVGIGGIGSTLANDLTAMLEYKNPGSSIILVDGDTYEAKNKERQAFVEYGNKAESKAAELVGLFERTHVVPIGRWVVSEVEETSTDDEEETKTISADDLIQEGSVVFAVVDNDMTRRVLFDAAAKRNNVDVFSGGNSDRLDGSVYHYRRRDGQDITSHPALIHPQYENPADKNPGEMSCQERAEIEGGTQIIAANRSVAAIMLSRVQYCIFEDNPPGKEAEIYFDWEIGSALGYDRTPVSVEEPVGVGSSQQ